MTANSAAAFYGQLLVFGGLGGLFIVTLVAIIRD